MEERNHGLERSLCSFNSRHRRKQEPESKIFFLSLVDHQRLRIEWLHVRIFDGRGFPTESWNPLRRPSKAIEHFHFSIDTPLPIIPTVDDPRQLLSGQAPRIRDYYASFVEKVEKPVIAAHACRTFDAFLSTHRLR
ncbi:hypothetical protein GALMADRAFT_221161 [Galerina marginata CBS 339.88]|uniref:Uncharacterized protein n=1 Tax=Galerina marginata (strain CBS 339.88) TaxID=685588 RepID=A0A067TJ27_GALM3|nr:hypothetical protein GALMADRAFT_221161 [Galerina marginata CBS 339.88]